MIYNLYYTLNINLDNKVLTKEKKEEIIKNISFDKGIKNEMYILLILEHACNESETMRDDILKGILPYNMYQENSMVYIDETKLPDKLFLILDKAYIIK